MPPDNKQSTIADVNVKLYNSTLTFRKVVKYLHNYGHAKTEITWKLLVEMHVLRLLTPWTPSLRKHGRAVI